MSAHYREDLHPQTTQAIPRKASRTAGKLSPKHNHLPMHRDEEVLDKDANKTQDQMGILKQQVARLQLDNQKLCYEILRLRQMLATRTVAGGGPKGTVGDTRGISYSRQSTEFETMNAMSKPVTVVSGVDTSHAASQSRSRIERETQEFLQLAQEVKHHDIASSSDPGTGLNTQQKNRKANTNSITNATHQSPLGLRSPPDTPSALDPPASPTPPVVVHAPTEGLPVSPPLSPPPPWLSEALVESFYFPPTQSQEIPAYPAYLAKPTNSSPSQTALHSATSSIGAVDTSKVGSGSRPLSRPHQTPPIADEIADASVEPPRVPSPLTASPPLVASSTSVSGSTIPSMPAEGLTLLENSPRSSLESGRPKVTFESNPRILRGANFTLRSKYLTGSTQNPTAAPVETPPSSSSKHTHSASPSVAPERNGSGSGSSSLWRKRQLPDDSFPGPSLPKIARLDGEASAKNTRSPLRIDTLPSVSISTFASPRLRPEHLGRLYSLDSGRYFCLACVIAQQKAAVKNPLLTFPHTASSDVLIDHYETEHPKISGRIRGSR